MQILPQVQHVALTGRASRFVGLLVEFGHLSAPEATDFMLALTALGRREHGPVDLPTARRFAAQWLFAGRDPVEPGSPLDEDWPILFS